MTDKNLNTGNGNTGDWNAGNGNTGNGNTGDWNAGNGNTGDWNTGDWNAGYRNTGNGNTGDWNAGYRNTGNGNTGDWNTGDWNAGYFNQETPYQINIFDSPANKSDWDSCDKPDFIYFALAEFVCESEMTQKEKDENETFGNIGGYLKKKDYKEAFKESYSKATKEDREKIFNIPNFDAEKFLAISGIDVRIDSDIQEKKKMLIEKADELLKQAEEL